jgi:ABC-type multidrug transport system fused ATPase/permease subunit
VKDYTSVNARIQQGAACAERIFEILDVRPGTVEKSACIPLARFQKTIEYKNISFSYRTGPVVLDKINFEIRAGEVVAIVGPSGAGKTTLTLLLPRLMDPKEGGIFIDGTDVRDVSLQSLRNQIGIVTQDVILFNETVQYNIAYGKGAGDTDGSFPAAEEIIRAAKIANAHEFIQELPQGYNSVVGERGVRLSGGQKQRLSIARAVLKNPPILILDEATSSLDAESERLVQEALERLMENRTVLVVAHRLSTVRKADRILVLDDGKIVEEGNHEMLLAQGGHYKKLYQIQVHN